ncbi:MAG: hypothetical protein JW709_13930 [Sedimentisphaerales bacterium]|nr:hypothetical protein [Sedimentisphaerales bacterium]
MGRRRDRLDGRLERATAVRQENSTRKACERNRRDAQMIELMKTHSFPYTPAVMSWLSVKLGKRASRITPKDISALIK